MNGLSEQEILEQKEKATKYLNSLGYDVINTFFESDTFISEDVKNIPMAYLAKSIYEMSKVDLVYFLNGWRNARGCLCEHVIAEKYGLKILYESC